MNGPIAAIVLGELAFVAFVIWVVARFKLERRRQASEERMRRLGRDER
jgi:flagellar biogenesis protein FliO